MPRAYDRVAIIEENPHFQRNFQFGHRGRPNFSDMAMNSVLDLFRVVFSNGVIVIAKHLEPAQPADSPRFPRSF